MVQRLRLQAANAGGLASILGQGIKSHMLQLKTWCSQKKKKNPPAMQETWVLSLDWEDPLEKGMAAHSSILAWQIPWTEEPGGLQSMGSRRVGHNLSDLACMLCHISSAG